MEKELDAQRKSGEIDSLRLSLAHREDDIQVFKQMQMDKSLGMLDELNRWALPGAVASSLTQSIHKQPSD